MTGVAKIITIIIMIIYSKNAKYNEDILKWSDAVELYYCIYLTSSNSHEFKNSL